MLSFLSIALSVGPWICPAADQHGPQLQKAKKKKKKLGLWTCWTSTSTMISDFHTIGPCNICKTATFACWDIDFRSPWQLFILISSFIYPAHHPHICNHAKKNPAWSGNLGQVFLDSTLNSFMLSRSLRSKGEVGPRVPQSFRGHAIVCVTAALISADIIGNSSQTIFDHPSPFSSLFLVFSLSTDYLRIRHKLLSHGEQSTKRV